MKQLIECSTCGYPLLPEEREGLVEIDGKMCKPINGEPMAWMDSEGDVYPMPENPKWCPPHVLLYTAPPQRKPLSDEKMLDLATNWFAEDWAIKKAIGLLRDYDIEQAHGIGGEE